MRTRVLDDDERRPYRGTQTAIHWLAALEEYQRLHRAGAVPPKTDWCFGSVGLWIQRMRRYAANGRLSINLAWALVARGIRLDQDRVRQICTRPQEEEAFHANLADLTAWAKEAPRDAGGKAHLTYGASRATRGLRSMYSFLEHLVLKARQGVLSGEHRRQIELLPILINGKTTAQWLSPGPSLRRVEDPELDGEYAMRSPLWGFCSVSEVGVALDRLAKKPCGPQPALLYLVGIGIRAVVDIQIVGTEELEVGLQTNEDATRLVFRGFARARGDVSGTWYLTAPAGVEALLILRAPPAIAEAKAPAQRRAGSDTGPGKPLGKGERYGALTVVERVPRPVGQTHSGHFYRCRCDCGTEVIRQREYIVDRDFPTCGCRIQYNLAGKVFGKLTVLSEVRRLDDGGRNTEWKVRCECGNEAWVRASSLKAGKTRSCGCMRGQPKKIQEPEVPPRYRRAAGNGVPAPGYIQQH